MIKIVASLLSLFALAIVLSNNIYAQSGLVSYWPADGNANDVVGINSGTLQNGATYRPGASGQAFSFDGVNALFQAPTNGFPTYDGNRTLSMWVKVDTPVAPDAIFGGYGAFGTTYAVYSLGESAPGAYASSGGTGVGGPSLEPGRWYHLAATNTTSHMTLYLDGNAVAQRDFAISTPAGTQFYSGRIPGTVGDNTRLKGAVDEIMVFNRALTGTEIQALYQQVTPPAADVTSGPISHWPADGDTNDVVGGNNGTLQNGATYRQGVSGQAFSFDGADDLFQAPTVGLPVGNRRRTLAMWVNVDAPVTQEAFFGGYGAFGSTYATYYLGVNSGLFATSWGTGVGGPSLQSGRWYHVAVTNVLDVLTLYLDGAVVATAHNVAVSTPFGTQFYSGRIPGVYGDIRRLQGAVDEIRVYNRALLPSEIAALAISDSTAPYITPTITGTFGSNGWYTGDVAVSWTVTDTESAVSSSTGCDTSNVTSDTSGETFICSATSGGGTATQYVTVKRDTTVPVISVTAPTSGTYLLNQAATINFSCSDGLSGIASCDGSSADGSALDTATVGAKSVTVTATDNAGNTASTIVNYTVGYGVEALYDQTRAHRSGTTIPIKIRLVDATGVNVSSPALLPHAISVIQVSSQASTEFGDAGNSNPDFNFRYDPSLNGYIFNLQTTGFGTGSYRLQFIVGTAPTVYSVGFQVRN